MRLRLPRSAFSLVELLVAVGIIALLTAVLVPAVGLARRAAWRAGCLSNLHQIAVALNAYGNDNGGQLPVYYAADQYPAAVSVPFPGGFNNEVRADRAGLALLFLWPPGTPPQPHVTPQAYLSTAKVLRCPGQAAHDDPPLLATGLAWPGNAGPVPTGNGIYLGYGSYSYGYVPPTNAMPNALEQSLVGFQRSTLRLSNADRRSIVWDACLSVVGPGPHGVDLDDFHDARDGGDVLYLDGHAVWQDGPPVRRAVTSAGNLIQPAFFGAVDR